MHMETLSQFIIENTQADSIGSVVIRGGVWLILVTIFAWGAAKGKEATRIKSEAGFFLLFVALTAAAIYLAFGFIPTVTSIEETLLLPVFSTPLLAERGANQLQKISSYFPQI